MNDLAGGPLSPAYSSKFQGEVTRPVSARTFSRLPSNSAAEAANEGVKMWTNDLFTESGDVLGSGDNFIGAHHNTASHVSSLNPSQASQKLQNQKSLAAQKRLERMQSSGVATTNDSVNRSRPVSAIANRPGSGLQHTLSSTSSMDSMSAPVVAFAETSTSTPRHASNIERNLKAMNVAAQFDPTVAEDVSSDEGAGPSVVASASSAKQKPSPKLSLNPAKPEITDIRSFLMTPGPTTRPMLCYIVRDKTGPAKMYPRYSLFLEDGNKFLVSARKRKKSRSSNYLLSLNNDELARHGSSYFGKVRSNFVGTDFIIYDKGDKPGKEAGNGMRQDYGAVTYQYNVLGTRGPRKMTAAIPRLDEQSRKLMRPLDENDTVLERLKSNRGLGEVVVLKNKPPKWNESLNAYCLNFNGRVTEASVKNFQLISDDDKDYIILQFGKVGKDTFTMDFHWPMTAFQAFSICLTSFDNKLACE